MCFHTALWLADNNLLISSYSRVLRQPCGWQGQPLLSVYRSMSEKEAPSHSPYVFVLVCDWLRAGFDTVIPTCSQFSLWLAACFLWTRKCSDIKNIYIYTFIYNVYNIYTHTHIYMNECTNIYKYVFYLCIHRYAGFMYPYICICVSIYRHIRL